MDQSLQFTTHHLYGNELSSELRETGIKGPGIYVLHFANNTQYVGKSDDVASRISRHLREQDQRIVRVDVAAVTYMETDVHEVITIFERQAAGEQLMNELHNKPVPLRPDGLPVRDAQSVEGIRWALLASEDEVAQRPLRLRVPTGTPASPGTAKLLSSPAVDEALQVLNTYVTQVLRCPADTEWTYWKAWVPAGRLTANGRPLARLIVRNEVLLTVWEHPEGFVYAQAGLHHRYTIDPSYEPVRVKRPNPSKLLQSTALHQDDFCRSLLEDPDYLAAARAIARELMVDGPCTKGDAVHDWALADAIFDAHSNTSQGTS